MHDLDRTQLEADGSGEFESLGDEFEYSYESDNEFESAGLEGEDVLSELDEMELAGDMLEIESEEELDQFIGKLFKKIGAAAKKVIRSPLGKHIGGFLKRAAKKVLPLAQGDRRRVRRAGGGSHRRKAGIGRRRSARLPMICQQC